MAATMAELEARIAALEAERADYRAVLTAVNALGQNQRDQVEQLRALSEGQQRLTEAQQRFARDQSDTNARVRSIEENLAEVKDLLIRALNR